MAQKQPQSILPELLKNHEAALLDSWVSSRGGAIPSGVSEDDFRRHSQQFLRALQESMQAGSPDNVEGAAWERTREILSDISTEQARQGATPVEIATSIFSLKEPLFNLLQTEYGSTPEVVVREIWNATRVLDSLGLYTTSVALSSREELIARQQAEMLELSTPVVKLWDGVLALPLIGTLDSERTQVVMESLLEEIVRTGAAVAIIDITGVPTVDTLVAQHLLKTVAAARLMGAECIISGIRPQIASTIVHLGVDLGDVTTRATLADAFRIALHRSGRYVATLARKQDAE